MPPRARSDLLTSALAAKLLGVTPATVRGLARSGGLPIAATANGIRLFARRDVEELARVRAERSARKAPSHRR